MRISDWSSDVCSSDLRVAGRQHANRAFEKGWKLLDDLGAAARSALREDEPADDDRENDKSRADKEAQDEKRQRDDQRNDDDDSQHDFGLKFNACPPYQMAQIGRAPVCNTVTNAHLLCRL